MLDEATAGLTPLVATDDLGVINRMWPVTNVEAISAVSAVVGPKPVFIADGHHRYETACTYRQHVYESGASSPEHPANFVLMMFVAMEDPGLIVLPTHRLFRGLPPVTSGELAAALGAVLHDRAGGRRAGGGHRRLGGYRDRGRPGGDGPLHAEGWPLAVGPADGRRPGPHGPDRQGAHARVARTGRGPPAPPGDRGPVGRQGPAQAQVRAPGRGGGRGAAAASFPWPPWSCPPRVDHIRTISLGGERMPAKSTYFYPKLLSGLVLNPLE